MSDTSITVLYHGMSLTTKMSDTSITVLYHGMSLTVLYFSLNVKQQSIYIHVLTNFVFIARERSPNLVCDVPTHKNSPLSNVST